MTSQFAGEPDGAHDDVLLRQQLAYHLCTFPSSPIPGDGLVLAGPARRERPFTLSVATHRTCLALLIAWGLAVIAAAVGARDGARFTLTGAAAATASTSPSKGRQP
jgi:hypothetical protein